MEKSMDGTLNKFKVMKTHAAKILKENSEKELRQLKLNRAIFISKIDERKAESPNDFFEKLYNQLGKKHYEIHTKERELLTLTKNIIED